ncbi:MAG: Asp-tRNA(Asn)/Glu-tRNA(Gln) amidotransferase subunit GatC [Anaerolineae bacterium]|nr:Asp-tRNA(Asn)/Glu-tRNA(Gln) amidotransferase subunit GatC [Anaerolineae bacterium]
MALTREDVKKVAHLARLALTEAEIEQYREQLSKVLDYVASIEALDLDQVPPTAHAVPLQNVLRDDEVRPSLPPQVALFNAPLTADQQFFIQRVLDA